MILKQNASMFDHYLLDLHNTSKLYILLENGFTPTYQSNFSIEGEMEVNMGSNPFPPPLNVCKKTIRKELLGCVCLEVK